MRTVYKFPLEIEGVQTVKIPACYNLLHVAMQRDVLTLWAEVVTENRLVDVTILIFGTGHSMPDTHKEYIGTVFQGPFVWHVYSATAAAKNLLL